MINPAPVSTSRNSPYSTTSSAGIPPTPSQNIKPAAPRIKRGAKALMIIAGVLVLAAGVLGWKYVTISRRITVAHEGTTSQILKYNPDDKKSKLDLAAFTKFGDGRFNVLLLGAGGAGHTAPWLTDSVKVVSVDTINNTATIVSIPRDFYYNNSKINSVYQYGEEKKKGGGCLAAREAVGTILGINISNCLLVDFAATKQVVDALGGIEVTVPKGFTDYSFPDDKMQGYAPFTVKAGLQTMNGDFALKYARTRKADSDFERQNRQNLIIAAIKDKATTAGVLANPVKVNNLINALGDHIRTDIQAGDIPTLVNEMKNIPTTAISSFVLDTRPELGLLMSSSNTAAGYIVYPIDGVKSYARVQQWYQSISRDPLVTREAPTVTVAVPNTVSAKSLDTFVTALKDYGFTVTVSTTPPAKTVTSTTLYARNDENPISGNYLADFLKVTKQDGSPLKSSSDFEIIYIPSAATAKR